MRPCHGVCQEYGLGHEAILGLFFLMNDFRLNTVSASMMPIQNMCQVREITHRGHAVFRFYGV